MNFGRVLLLLYVFLICLSIVSGEVDGWGWFGVPRGFGWYQQHHQHHMASGRNG